MPCKAYKASVIHFLDNPGKSASHPENIEYFENGLLVVEDGKVVKVGDYSSIFSQLNDDIEVVDFSDKLIVPGLIDTHIHYPQTDIIAAPGDQLLDWLDTFTFPAERAFNNQAVADETADFFLNELLRNGTTTALVFATVHSQSVESFFSAAQKRQLRMISGKVMMDRNCPDYLQDTPQSAYQDSKTLIEKWHGVDRLHYAVTPRFAPTSSNEQLAIAGKLLTEYDDLYLHTHVAENLAEIEWVKKLFPDSRSYLDVYHQYGLLQARSVLAHCIHLDHDDKQLMQRTGSACAFCATSNLFLGSGLFDVNDAWDYGVNVGVGTDIGGGTSFNLLQTLAESYKVTKLLGKSLSAYQALYLATLGGAKSLYLDDKLGNFAIGKEADFVVLNFDSTPLIKRRIANSSNLHEKLFPLMMLGDDRSVSAVYIMGELAKIH